MKIELQSYKNGKKVYELVDFKKINSIKVFKFPEQSIFFLDDKNCKTYYNSVLNYANINLLLELFEANNIEYDLLYQNMDFPLNYYTIEDFLHRNLNFEDLEIDEDYEDRDIPYIINDCFNKIIILNKK